VRDAIRRTFPREAALTEEEKAHWTHRPFTAAGSAAYVGMMLAGGVALTVLGKRWSFEYTELLQEVGGGVVLYRGGCTGVLSNAARTS
jgi:hypothetical protein